LVEVKQPAKLGAFLLARTIRYDGEPRRCDVVGGSRLTKGLSRRPEAILKRAAKGYGVLPSLRYSDTAPGSDTVKLLKKLAPQREDWARMQRALLEMVPADHVSEGTFNVGFERDVPGPEREFRLLDEQGRDIQVCTNDGCGFLKFETAMQIPAVREQFEAWQRVREGLGSERDKEIVARHEQAPSRISAQALMHYPRSQAVAREAKHKLRAKLDRMCGGQPETLTPASLDKLTLNQLLVNGGYEGVKLRAVPSADGKLHLPASKSAQFDAHGGDVLLGKAPYDKENLLPLKAAQVGTVANGDATAAFLDRCFAIQYSYTGWDDASDPRDPYMLHAKGMLIVPPPGCWSPAHADKVMVCSSEDVKTYTPWTHARERDKLPTGMPSTGSLRMKEFTPPGAIGAITIEDLRRHDMDCDGDDGFLYADAPQLTAHIDRTLQERNARRGTPVSFKPKKTAQPAIDAEGNYQVGRGKEILGAMEGSKLVGESSSSSMNYVSQPDEVRQSLAEQFLYGAYDGIERELRNGLRDMLRSGGQEGLDELLALADEGVAKAHQLEARQAAELLRDEMRRLRAGDAPPPNSDARRFPPDELCERFPQLAKEFGSATTTVERIHAILDNYPVLQLSHKEFPQGQPGWIEGEPDLTVRNVFTMAIKAGTDKQKTNTDTRQFSKLVERYRRLESHERERVKSVPYTKATTALLRDDRFDADQTMRSLVRIPTAAAEVMQANIEVLAEYGLLPPTNVRAKADVTPQEIEEAAQELATTAGVHEPAITGQLRAMTQQVRARLVGLDQRLRGQASLKAELTRSVLHKGVSLQEAKANGQKSLRYSVVLDDTGFTTDYRRLLASLDDAGYEKIRVVNHFVSPQAFSAVSVTLRSPAGQPLEIQFHTQGSFDLKNEFHDTYKELEKMGAEGAARELQNALLMPVRKAFRALSVPPDCQEIEDYERFEVQASNSAGTRTRAVRDTAARAPLRVSTQAQNKAERARAIEPQVTCQLRDLLTPLELRLSGDGTLSEQAWSKHKFKSEKSIERKLRMVQDQRGLSAEQSKAHVRDALRYVVKIKDGQFTQKVRQCLEALPGLDLTPMRLRNGFAGQDSSFAVVNLQVRTREGDDFEIQFHTESSLKAKNQGSKDYHKLRDLAPPPRAGDDDDEALEPITSRRDQLLDKLRARAANVAPPAGIEQLASFDRYPSV
jgi:hypothetical protein